MSVKCIAKIKWHRVLELESSWVQPPSLHKPDAHPYNYSQGIHQALVSTIHVGSHGFIGSGSCSIHVQVDHSSLHGIEMALHVIFPLVLVCVPQLHRIYLNPTQRPESLLDICWGNNVYFRKK